MMPVREAPKELVGAVEHTLSLEAQASCFNFAGFTAPPSTETVVGQY